MASSNASSPLLRAANSNRLKGPNAPSSKPNARVTARPSGACGSPNPAPTIGVVQLSLEARANFAAWLQENLQLQEALGSIEPALEAHIAKYSAFALHLALTFHAARVVAHEHEEARDPAAFPMPAATLQQALALLKRASQHALALYLGRKGAASEAYEIARSIARFIVTRSAQDNAAGLRRRDLIQRVGSFRDADEGVQAAAVRLLIDLGWLREAEGAYLKAQPTRFTVNPSLHTRFAAFAEKERQHRALARARIKEAAEIRRADREDSKC
jgi:hypothetical protein